MCPRLTYNVHVWEGVRKQDASSLQWAFKTTIKSLVRLEFWDTPMHQFTSEELAGVAGVLDPMG